MNFRTFKIQYYTQIYSMDLNYILFKAASSQNPLGLRPNVNSLNYFSN